MKLLLYCSRQHWGVLGCRLHATIVLELVVSSGGASGCVLTFYSHCSNDVARRPVTYCSVHVLL